RAADEDARARRAGGRAHRQHGDSRPPGQADRRRDGRPCSGRRLGRAGGGPRPAPPRETGGGGASRAGVLSFARPGGGRPRWHLSVCERDSGYWTDQLAFRNALRADPDLARHYGELKLRLATEHLDDRLAYTRGKTAFVRRALAASGREAATGWAASRPLA